MERLEYSAVFIMELLFDWGRSQSIVHAIGDQAKTSACDPLLPRRALVFA